MAVPAGPERLPAPSAALIVLDGWGIAPDGPGNAVSLADTPVFDELWPTYPTSQLTACGRAVGLPEGQMGNSEVGHLNLGAGAVVMQDLTRIDVAVEPGELATNPVLQVAFSGAERVHLIGLVSDGGVYSGFTHLEALIRMGAELDVPDLVLHAFTDGRDTLPKAGAGFLATAGGWMAQTGSGRIGSVVGRYYAMDRDRRWDRIQLAYDLLVHGRAEPGFDEIDRGGVPPIERYAAMTEYVEGWPYPVAFPPEHPSTTLSVVIAAQGARQLHVAETEKYPHVTYFFNGGEEAPCAGERRELVPSPRDVPTYDYKPEMRWSMSASAAL